MKVGIGWISTNTDMTFLNKTDSGQVTDLHGGFMSKKYNLNAEQLATLRLEISNEELSIFSVVRLARLDMEAENFDGAITRLRVDADKIRTISPELAAFITQLNG